MLWPQPDGHQVAVEAPVPITDSANVDVRQTVLHRHGETWPPLDAEHLSELQKVSAAGNAIQKGYQVDEKQSMKVECQMLLCLDFLAKTKKIKPLNETI